MTRIDKELEHWATKPDTQLAYYSFIEGGGQLYRANFRPVLAGAYVSLWPGQRIGKIISARVYRHNMGSRMVSMRVQGTNGATYYGRASWDNGTCINLRRAK